MGQICASDCMWQRSAAARVSTAVDELDIRIGVSQGRRGNGGADSLFMCRNMGSFSKTTAQRTGDALRTRGAERDETTATAATWTVAADVQSATGRVLGQLQLSRMRTSAVSDRVRPGLSSRHRNRQNASRALLPQSPKAPSGTHGHCHKRREQPSPSLQLEHQCQYFWRPSTSGPSRRRRLEVLPATDDDSRLALPHCVAQRPLCCSRFPCRRGAPTSISNTPQTSTERWSVPKDDSGSRRAKTRLLACVSAPAAALSAASLNVAWP